MKDKRNLGVTEARFGLTFLICLMVGAGYIVLQQLGGSREAPTIEFRPGIGEAPLHPHSKPAGSEEQPQVLIIESGETPVIQTSQRPAKPTDENDASPRSPAPELPERR